MAFPRKQTLVVNSVTQCSRLGWNLEVSASVELFANTEIWERCIWTKWREWQESGRLCETQNMKLAIIDRINNFHLPNQYWSICTTVVSRPTKNPMMKVVLQSAITPPSEAATSSRSKMPRFLFVVSACKRNMVRGNIARKCSR